MSCYERLLSHYPGSVVTAVAAVAGVCLVIAFTAQDLPDFSDPQLGFESRGTELAQRAVTWDNLIGATKRNGPLTLNPLEAKWKKKDRGREQKRNSTSRGTKRTSTTSRPLTDLTTTTTKSNESPESEIVLPLATWTPGNDTNDLPGIGDGERSRSHSGKGWPLQVLRIWNQTPASNHSHSGWGDPQMKPKAGSFASNSAFSRLQQQTWTDLETLGAMGYLRTEHPKQFVEETPSSFFCDQPQMEYSHVVFAAQAGKSLFTLPAIHSMCSLEESLLRNNSFFPTLCIHPLSSSRCCSSWSLGHFIARMHNKSSCFEVTEPDALETLTILQSCLDHYREMELTPDCGVEDEDNCPHVPLVCSKHNDVYNILHYIADVNFLQQGNTKLEFATLFLPMARSSATLEYYQSLEDQEWKDNVTQIVAVDFGLKTALFNEQIVNDTVFLSIAGALVLIFMWIYTGSLFLTVMSVTAVIMSVGMGYFFYTFIFELKFFPFMNLLAAVIVIGLGTDDAFLYVKIWEVSKLEKDSGPLVKLVRATLRHASLSMLVTSLTTAAAFAASFLCPITAIRCFSLFAGTTVLINLLLMLTWLPATLVLADKYCSTPPCLTFRKLASLVSAKCPVTAVLADMGHMAFDKVLPYLVLKLRYLWVVLLGGLAIGGGVVVFYYPGLRLPDSREFQLFAESHLFEQYDLVYKDRFRFERAMHSDLDAQMPLRFVWGVLPLDNGNYLNPSSKGSLTLDQNFNMADPESQQWLLDFCKNLRQQDFYQPMLGPLLPNCFIETFKSWMDRKCFDEVDRMDRSPCCELAAFPFAPEIFSLCILEATRALYETPAQFFLPGLAGPRFSKESHQVAAVVVEYDSNVTFSMSFTEMDAFYRKVENWTQDELRRAPKGMRNGFFISYLSFYDAQKSLSEGTMLAIGVAMAIAFAVLLLSTGNLLVSFFAVVTLSSVVMVTIAILVLLGWKLNILESVSVSIAIGLSVDFTLHYGVVYKLCPNPSREAKVLYSLSRMGSPVAMGALTTFVAGAAMLPSTVLAYIQIGTFITVVMSISWIYATFFLQSLLRIWGPQDQFGQLRYPSCRCCSKAQIKTHVDKTVYSCTMSESTLSTSSANCGGAPQHPPVPVATVSMSEFHEMEPLTNHVIHFHNNASKSHRSVLPGLRGTGGGGNRPRSGSLAGALLCPSSTSIHGARVRANPSYEVENNANGIPSRARKVSLPEVALLPQLAQEASLMTSPTWSQAALATSATTVLLPESDYEGNEADILAVQNQAHKWNSHTDV